ncbi:MAG: glycosyltransferase 87 family protein [Propionibacteriaceae bacterium]
MSQVSKTSNFTWSKKYLALAWALPKTLVITLWLCIAPGVQGDVFYYFRSLERMSEVGAHTLIEYPTPVIWVLQIPHLFSFGYQRIFLFVFIFFMLLLDAIFTVALWRRWQKSGSQKHPWAVLFWIGFTLLMSPTAYLRFDMIPAVLAGGALLLIASKRPAWAGALIGIGAATKLWPALLWLALLGRRQNRKPATLGFWGVGGGLALLSLIWGGWSRLISPLTWQKDRGLQIESVWANVPVIQRIFDPSFYVEQSRYQAFEIFGSGVGAWVLAADTATKLLVLGVLTLCIWWWRSSAATDITATGLLMLIAATVMIIGNKTFSPQYLLWLGGLIAAVLAVAPADSVNLKLRTSSAGALAAIFLVVTALTAVVYPLCYDYLIHDSGVTTTLISLCLVARNVIFLGFFAFLVTGFVKRIRFSS